MVGFLGKLVVGFSLIFCSMEAYAGTTGSSDYGDADIKPLALTEFTPLKVRNRGPAKADGVVYFIEGLDKDARSRDAFTATYPIVYEMNRSHGFDIIEAKFPNNQAYTMSSIAQSSQYVLKRLSELRVRGYKRVILAGQSWGAWVSIDAAARRNAVKPMDSLLLIAPANYGMKEYNGSPNAFFILNKTEFLQNIKSVHVPTAAVFFRDDEYDPGGRGPATRRTYADNGVPLLLIDAPAGFAGHGAAWIPRFAALYGACIDAFMKQHAPVACGILDWNAGLSTPLVRLENDLLRAPGSARPASLDDIDGRTFIVTLPNSFVSIWKFARNRADISTMGETYSSPMSERGQLTCFDKDCRKLYQIKDGGFVTVDDRGDVTAWMIPID